MYGLVKSRCSIENVTIRLLCERVDLRIVILSFQIVVQTRDEFHLTSVRRNRTDYGKLILISSVMINRSLTSLRFDVQRRDGYEIIETLHGS